MIARRAALLGTGCALISTRAARAARTLRFRVHRNGDPIGTHELTFDPVTDGLDVHIAVDIAVGLGPITLFRYRLRAVEQWRQGTLQRLQGTTDNDGDAEFIDAQRDAAGLLVRGSAGPAYRAPAEAIPGTHWNQAEIGAPWINPQNGKLMRLAVTEAGPAPLPRIDGAKLTAHRFALDGDARMELWYGQDRGWTALRAPGRDGSTITYDLI